MREFRNLDYSILGNGWHYPLTSTLQEKVESRGQSAAIKLELFVKVFLQSHLKSAELWFLEHLVWRSFCLSDILNLPFFSQIICLDPVEQTGCECLLQTRASRGKKKKIEKNPKKCGKHFTRKKRLWSPKSLILEKMNVCVLNEK